MSWPDTARRLAVASAATLALAGCIRPLYGPTASGVPLQQVLSAVDVANVSVRPGQEHIAHEIRSELIYDLDGSGQTHEKKYRLEIEAAEAVQATTVDVTTGRADTAFLNVTARFNLFTIDGRKPVLTGTSRTYASYSRDSQRFASVRAARDAETRASKQIADDIRQRIAATLATAP